MKLLNKKDQIMYIELLKQNLIVEKCNRNEVLEQKVQTKCKVKYQIFKNKFLRKQI